MALIARRDLMWVGFFAASCACRILPRAMRLKAAGPLGRGLGTLWRRFDRSRASQARSNLELLLGPGSPDLDHHLRTFFRTMAHGLLVLEIVPTLPLAHLLRFLSVEGGEHLEAALAQGRGVVLIGAHFGLHGYAATMFLQRLGYEIAVVTAEGIARPDASAFYRQIMLPVRYRFHRGIRVIMRTGMPQRSLVTWLRGNRILMIMGDAVDEEVQHLRPPNIIPAPLLRFSLPLSTGPFRLARWVGASVVPFFMVPNERGFTVQIQPPLALSELEGPAAWRADLASFTARLEPYLSRYPSLWFGPLNRDLTELLHPEPAGV